LLGCFFGSISPPIRKENTQIKEQYSQLKLENKLLNSQIEGVYEWLLFEERIGEQMERLKELSSLNKQEDLYWNSFFRRRAEELRQILEIELQSLPAKIIFRDPSSWNSCVWVNIGKKENEALGRTIIAIDSPVVLGDALVGVVEYVGEKQSRVRLITDESIVPSVRAVRGSSQNRAISELIKSLEDRMYDRNDLFSSEEEKNGLFDHLNSICTKIKETKDDWYLAKGELHGTGHPLWRKRGKILKGIGFNYDYADEEGLQRDLRTGEVIEKKQSKIFPKIPVLEKGDLLMTTGLDGVFPAGLQVGVVTKVFDITEGGYSYDIEAKPAMPDINELNILFIMPPVDFSRKKISDT
jgi:cell shape-determining protein MreC